jgi:hypothetical protein
VFWKLGHRWFLSGLVWDCTTYLHRVHSANWLAARQKREDGEWTKLGKDQEAITSMLWHITHTNWFDFHAKSRLVYLRFPIHYQKEAQDGVEVFFEQPGPTTREAQQMIADAKTRTMVKDKIFKVMKRRYLLRTGIKVKLLIKYFAVPKGGNDTRVVYDATANNLND